MSRHRQRWDSVYVPWCEQHQCDAYAYNIPQVVNFLEDEQQRFERAQDAANKSHNHSGFKESRAAVATFLQLIYPHMPRVSDHHHVKSIAAELRKSAPNLPKYVTSRPSRWIPSSCTWCACASRALRSLACRLSTSAIGL
jgi:hypothetical protein